MAPWYSAMSTRSISSRRPEARRGSISDHLVRYSADVSVFAEGIREPQIILAASIPASAVSATNRPRPRQYGFLFEDDFRYGSRTRWREWSTACSATDDQRISLPRYRPGASRNRSLCLRHCLCSLHFLVTLGFARPPWRIEPVNLSPRRPLLRRARKSSRG
jgi:hypothetical protein